jgi:hypothetical protein
MQQLASDPSTKTCIIKFNPTDTTDFSTINTRYDPNSDANDENKSRISCVDTGEAYGTPLNPIVQPINLITKFDSNSRTVALSFKRKGIFSL